MDDIANIGSDSVEWSNGEDVSSESTIVGNLDSIESNEFN